MGMKWILIVVVAILSCNGNQEPSGKQTDSLSTTEDTVTQQDFHTLYTDVVENLFVHLDHKDWQAAGTFYTDSSHVKYFRDLFPGGPDKIELLSLKSLANDFEIKGIASKKTDTIKLCLIMQIVDNKVTSQRTCN